MTHFKNRASLRICIVTVLILLRPKIVRVGVGFRSVLISYKVSNIHLVFSVCFTCTSYTSTFVYHILLSYLVLFIPHLLCLNVSFSESWEKKVFLDSALTCKLWNCDCR